jgi:hypothetical protein
MVQDWHRRSPSSCKSSDEGAAQEHDEPNRRSDRNSNERHERHDREPVASASRGTLRRRAKDRLESREGDGDKCEQ